MVVSFRLNGPFSFPEPGEDGYKGIKRIEIKYQIKDFPEPGDKYLFEGIKYINQCEYKKALQYFEKASIYDNEYGLVFVGVFYFMAFGVIKRDTQKSLSYFQKAASIFNNKAAQYLLGMMYYEGDTCTDQNYQTAINWLMLAADNGWTDAISFIGHFYRAGSILECDYGKAVYWLEKIALKDDNDTDMMSEGPLYLFGNEEFEVNLIEIAEEFERRVIVPDIGSIGPVQCANIFNELDKDPRLAMNFWDLMTMTSSNHVAKSQLFLGMMYMNGGINLTSNVDKALYWLKKAGKNGNPSAYTAIGEIYEKSFHDYKEAMKWFLKAKEHGVIDVLLNIGQLYLNEKFNDHSYKEGLLYFEAYNQHFQDGKIYYLMGIMCESGKYGLKQDFVKAFGYFLKAESNGLPLVATRIGTNYRFGKGIEKNEIKAFEWLSKGASLKCPVAYFELGSMYFSGYQGEIDLDKSLDFFKKAFQGGIPSAQEKINEIKIMQQMNNLNISTVKTSNSKKKQES